MSWYASAAKRGLPRGRVIIGVVVMLFVVYKLFNFGTESTYRSDVEAQVPANGRIQTNAHAAAGGAESGAKASKSKDKSKTSSAKGGLDQPQLENATFVTLARNQDLLEIVKSIRQVEDRVNHKFHYPWVFLNDEPFDDEFKRVTSAMCSGPTEYGVIPRDHWGFPDWIDQDKAKATREKMKEKGVIYGDSISYRHMCRYESGFFYRHPLVLPYRYYWRVEPSIKMFCDFDYDPFTLMREQGKVYGFTLSLHEYGDTIETLWDTTTDFVKKHPEYIAKDNLMNWLSDDGGATYSMCHFWSNFEIADADFWRSEAYSAYFEHLDQAGGFFYERWGDAPVHSIAAGLFLQKDQVHFFNDMGYWHVPFTHCPIEPEYREKCHCDVNESFDWRGWSCTGRFYDVVGLKKPSNWKDYSG